MANVKTQACDICGVHKLTANHWYLVFKVPSGLLILEWSKSSILERWKADPTVDEPDGELEGKYLTPGKADAHICGQTHLIEWLSKNFLGGQSNTP